MRSAPKLKKLYLRLNRRWFAGGLPRGLKIGWNKNLKWQGTLGWAWEDSGEYFIEINPEFRRAWRVVEITVIHEMAHIKLIQKLDNSGHGKEFQKEMLRLARKGAFKFLW